MDSETAADSSPRPLIATKLRPPVSLAGQYERPRIARLLDGALDDDVRLTLVSAPPGYGKTLAVASWLAAVRTPYAWLSLDPADNDPARFVRYLTGSLQRVRPGLPQLGPRTLAETGERLIDAVAFLDDPFVLVLDDYHVITAEPVHAIVRQLIAQGPPFMHIVVVTREDPPLALPRMRAHRQLVEVRASDLRFTLSEADGYLATRPGLALDNAQVAKLLDRTEGWIAGVQLAAISLRDRPDAATIVETFAGSQRFVLDYLAAETVDRLEPELREFLAGISVAARFTPALCAAITGRDDAAGLLDRAERLNLFLVPLDLDRRWYRFHHLFADYLRSLLEDGERRELHRRAAAWFEEAGLVGEAIEQALLADDTDRALRLAEMAARPTYELGEFGTLLGWVGALPADRLWESAELLTLAAASLVLIGRLSDASSMVALGEGALREHGQSAERLRAIGALLAAQLGRSDAGPLAQAALASLLGDDEFRPFALCALGSVQLAAGELGEAADAMRTALEASLTSQRAVLAVIAVSRLAIALNLSGHRGEAEAWCRRVLAEFGVATGAVRSGAAYVAWRLGMLRYEANDLTEARRELERAWQGLGATASMRGGIGFGVADIALLRLATGEAEASALEAIEVVRREVDAGRLPAIDERLAEISARIQLRSGNLAAATAWADRAERALSPGWSSLPVMLTIARVRLAQRRAADAAPHIRRASALARDAGDVADRVTIAVLEAARADQIGADASAREAIQQAVRLAAPERYLRRVIDDGSGVAHLLPAARRIAPAFVDEVLEALTAARETARVAGARVWRDERGSAVETLTARELEVLRLMAAGYGDAAIADGLVVSLATAKWHAAHVRSKLGAQTRTQALARARQLGLV